MKKILFSIISFSMLLFTGSCGSDELVCERASFDVITQTRDIEGFSSIAFNTVGDLYIKQGKEFGITLEGPDNVVELTTTILEGERLVVGSRSCFNGSYELKVEVTAPAWEKINFSGTGDLLIADTLRGDVIEIEMFGIGEVEAIIMAKELYTTISGQGNIALWGKAEKHEFISSGEFQLNSYNLKTLNTSIDLSGVGDCYVSAAEKLDVSISGTGNVYYKGSPLIQTDITGTGDVIDDN